MRKNHGRFDEQIAVAGLSQIKSRVSNCGVVTLNIDTWNDHLQRCIEPALFLYDREHDLLAFKGFTVPSSK